MVLQRQADAGDAGLRRPHRPGHPGPDRALPPPAGSPLHGRRCAPVPARGIGPRHPDREVAGARDQPAARVGAAGRGHGADAVRGRADLGRGRRHRPVAADGDDGGHRRGGGPRRVRAPAHAGRPDRRPDHGGPRRAAAGPDRLPPEGLSGDGDVGADAGQHHERADREPGGRGRAQNAPRRADRLRARDLPLCRPPVAGAGGVRPRDPARHPGRDHGPVGLGQDHAHPADPGPLRCRGGGDPDRRQRPARAGPGPSAPADRRRPAGELPLQGHHPRQPCRDPAGCLDARGRARGRACGGSRVHHPPAARLRHRHRGERHQPLGRPAAAAGDRARAPGRAPDPDLRRGHERPRPRERAHRAGEPGPDRQRPHGALS